MTKPQPDYGRDELLTALQDALQPKEGKRGLTTREICKRLDLSKARVRDMLRELHEQGRLQREPVYEQTYEGSRRRTMAYLLKESDGEGESLPDDG